MFSRLTTERIRNIYVFFAEFTFSAIAHEDVDRVFVINGLLAVLEFFALQIEVVFKLAFLQPLADMLREIMDKGSVNTGDTH